MHPITIFALGILFTLSLLAAIVAAMFWYDKRRHKAGREPDRSYRQVIAHVKKEFEGSGAINHLSLRVALDDPKTKKQVEQWEFTISPMHPDTVTVAEMNAELRLIAHQCLSLLFGSDGVPLKEVMKLDERLDALTPPSLRLKRLGYTNEKPDRQEGVDKSGYPLKVGDCVQVAKEASRKSDKIHAMFVELHAGKNGTLMGKYGVGGMWLVKMESGDSFNFWGDDLCRIFDEDSDNSLLDRGA